MARLALFLVAFFVAFFVGGLAMGAETEHLHLSGTGADDTVEWEFFCTEGRGCGEWTTIPVPSHWELQGFGGYNYGHDEKKHDEQGRYRYRFRLPESWAGKTIELIFDGVMTDAEVSVNGRSAGEIHQGAFYRFVYDVTELLDVQGDNLLEVTVRKNSTNRSVNLAERDADYWVFGGIFRPVFLQASPPTSVEYVAIDAKHDGTLKARARLRDADATRLEMQILDPEGVEADVIAIDIDGPVATLVTRLSQPRSWSAETPNLYTARFLLFRGGELLHSHSERFGFRTIEVRSEKGLFVNGHRVMLKGVNRHSFHPDSGRTLSRDLNYRDAQLIKSMNMNAVRMSHYPPEKSFLEACDELGLYVLNEIAGWHDAYDTKVGKKLVRQTVERDHNHPSILFWNNGNEGGWNSALDEVFGEHDLQRRPVLRPDSPASGIDTKHYLTWDELQGLLGERSELRRWISGPPPLVMPTELLHGLYDGGSGASLWEYWRELRHSPRGAGAFLWAFTDEAVVRTDRGGVLDTDGSHAPDGVLGPYREPSGNSLAVRDIFSPVALFQDRLDEPFDGRLEIENRHDMTDLSTVLFRWSWVALPKSNAAVPEFLELTRGETAGPAAAPGQRGHLTFPLPPKNADALILTAMDSGDRLIRQWVLPRWSRRQLAPRLVEEGAGAVTIREDDGRLHLTAGATAATFDLRSGELVSLDSQLALSGPRALPKRSTSTASVRHWTEGSSHVVEARYKKGLDVVRWRLHPSGWLRLTYQLRLEGEHDYFGVGFDLDKDQVRNFEWLGQGPARIWKNRREGGTLGVWRKQSNEDPGDVWGHEPKIAGFYGGVYWAKLKTDNGTLTLVLADDLDLGLLGASFPEDSKEAVAIVPDSGLSILNGISAIGTKFHAADELGPQGQPHRLAGMYRGTVWFYVDSRQERAFRVE